MQTPKKPRVRTRFVHAIAQEYSSVKISKRRRFVIHFQFVTLQSNVRSTNVRSILSGRRKIDFEVTNSKLLLNFLLDFYQKVTNLKCITKLLFFEIFTELFVEFNTVRTKCVRYRTQQIHFRLAFST